MVETIQLRNEKVKIKLPTVEGKLVLLSIYSCLWYSASAGELSLPSFCKISTLIFAIVGFSCSMIFSPGW